MLDRLNILSNEDFDGLALRWHKTCYSNFSSESKLQRLRKQYQTSTSIASTSCPCTSSTPKRRSWQQSAGRFACFAKHITTKRFIELKHSLKSVDVLERTATDPLMSIRLSGVCDLIAAEGCYHLTCLITFERRCMKAKASMVSLDNETDECMTKLCRELSAGLSRACVRHAGRMEKIREPGQRNWYNYTKEIPVEKDILLRSSSTVDWIKG